MASYPALDLRFAPGPGAGTLQDMLYAELDAFEPVAIQEYESGDGWRVFFRTPAARNAAHRALTSEFENALELRAVDVDDEDWARRSQASLRAIRAGRVVVTPPWDVPPDSRDSRVAVRDSKSHTAEVEVGNREPRTNRESRAANRDIVIIIDPSTGFGTGHHETTRLCLELMQQIDLTATRVIDVGTGSGVLAIAASKLGARDVVAIDNDPDALRNARDNVTRNRAEVQTLEADLSTLETAAADIVLANLTASVLQRLAERLRTLVMPAGALIVSGFSPEDVNDVTRALRCSTVKVVQEGAWAAARLERTE